MASTLNKPIVGMVSFGNGYLMVASDGGIFNFSNKPFYGSLGSHPPPIPIVTRRRVRLSQLRVESEHRAELVGGVHVRERLVGTGTPSALQIGSQPSPGCQSTSRSGRRRRAHGARCAPRTRAWPRPRRSSSG